MPLIGPRRTLLTPNKGVPYRIVVDGVVYERIRFGGNVLDILISSQPLYARAS